ncbi:hypothetical protein I4U23_001931 [Adineta vaga]|nr:hypothetical protein I4U23_001931 [Adineta vaga]
MGSRASVQPVLDSSNKMGSSNQQYKDSSESMVGISSIDLISNYQGACNFEDTSGDTDCCDICCFACFDG